MKTNKKTTKFLASIDEANKDANIEDLVKTLHDDDDVEVEHVSNMLGIISGKANKSIEDLQAKYKSRGLEIEPSREVTTKRNGNLEG